MTSGGPVHVVTVLLVYGLTALSSTSGQLTYCTYSSGICGCQSDQGPINLQSYQANGISTPDSFISITWNPCQDQQVGTVYGSSVLQLSGLYYDCGDFTSTSSMVSPTGELYFVLYSNDGQVITEIQCVCGSEETFGFSTTVYYLTSISYVYSLVLNSHNCCPYGNYPGGITIGDIVLIVFFAILFMYLLVGILYVLFVKEPGEEQGKCTRIFFALPQAIVDCVCRRKREDSTYEEVGGNYEEVGRN